MFTATKPKQFTVTAAARPINSRMKLLGELNAQQKVLNRSFDTAHSLLAQKNTKSNFKQMKLCDFRQTSLKRKSFQEDNGNYDVKLQNPLDKKYATENPNFFQLPPVKFKNQCTESIGNLNKTIAAIPCKLHNLNGDDNENVGVGNQQVDMSRKDEIKCINPMSKNGRQQLALVGKVEFCLKMHKIHNDVKAMFDVYGKLQKILKGKQRFEYTMLLRNASGDGPILQSIFYDFNNELQDYEIGCQLRVVGHFVGENRLRTYKIQKIMHMDLCQQNFTRIQNVTSFALLQNNLK